MTAGSATTRTAAPPARSGGRASSRPGCALHDELAQLLGALSVVLAAVDVTLERGETAAARAFVLEARGLAVDSLDHVRRAAAAASSRLSRRASPRG